MRTKTEILKAIAKAVGNNRTIMFPADFECPKLKNRTIVGVTATSVIYRNGDHKSINHMCSADLYTIEKTINKYIDKYESSTRYTNW